MSQAQQPLDTNALLSKWDTPFETPPFVEIQSSDYLPALETALEIASDEVRAILNEPSTPTFANTIETLENVGVLMDKIASVLFNLNECFSDNELQEITMKASLLLTKFQNDLMMNADLFQRVRTVYEAKDLSLTAEQQMLLKQTYLQFIRTGACLSTEQKQRFCELSEMLSALSLEFNQHVLNETNDYFLHLENREDLAGIPENILASAEKEAQDRNLKGWVFTLHAPSYRPFLTYADNRKLRERLWLAYNTRGNHGNTNDNKEIIRQMVNARLELAQLLGYSSYASFVLEMRMAKSSEEVDRFLREILSQAMPHAEKDMHMIEAYAHAQSMTDPIQHWDMLYYLEKIKKQQYAFDTEMLRPYFPLNRVLNGIFDLFSSLYQLEFRQTKTIPIYHKDVTTYEVWDVSKNQFMAVLYLDLFPRSNKQGGAWKTVFRDQGAVDNQDVRPLVQIVCNFPYPTKEVPSLLSFDETTTLLHEFGHAIHAILSQTTYRSLSGTNVYRDFVELPSQIMENWAMEKEFLSRFAKHYQTGEPLSETLVNNLIESKQFAEGYFCVRQVSLALLDLRWHDLSHPFEGAIEAFEQAASQQAELLPKPLGACTSTSFSHIFAGGYASGYYGYKWAEVLDADAFAAFKEEGIFNKATAQRFRKEILSKGGSLPPESLYKNFLGREPSIDPFLRRSGFL